MTEREAIEWLWVRVPEDKVGTYSAWTQGGTIEGYNCHGCGGEFESEWPKWLVPTDETFPHEKDCKYLEVKKVLKITH